MANAIGGAPGQSLVACNRCFGTGTWRNPRGNGSGVCFACKGSGLLDRERAARYLVMLQPRPTTAAQAQEVEALEPYSYKELAEQAMDQARDAMRTAEALGWVMGDPVLLSDRVELLGRNPKRPGRTVHLTWVISQRTRYSEWLDGPPSKHKDLLTEDA